jgi:LDH2 family malate/lactate/ureidoglycolate dehydrogenase
VAKVDVDPESNLMVFRSLYSPIDIAKTVCDKMMEASLSLLNSHGIPNLAFLLKPESSIGGA